MNTYWPFYGALDYGTYWDDLPETIVIGINQRNIEWRTAALIKTTAYLQEKELTFEFIGGELLPILKKKIPHSFKIIAGHDTTAGFFEFFHKDNLFNSYLIKPEFAPEMETRIRKNLLNQKKVYSYYQSSADGDIRQLANRKNLDANLKPLLIQIL
jgi:hypothetical protein